MLARFFFIIFFVTLTSFAAPLARADASDAFTFQSLMGLIKEKNIESIDDLIPELPESYRKYFVVMFKSGSLQNATPTSPRIISYGAYQNKELSDRLFIAFQTETQHRTDAPSLPNSLEVIEWKPEQKNYQFYQIDFSQGAPTVKVNPAICLSCHGNPARPNWTGYPRWPGALGNNNGLTGAFEGVDPLADKTHEAHALIDRLKSVNPRLHSLDFGQFFTQNLEYPNAYFSGKIQNQLIIRDVELIRKNPMYKQFKYALAGGFMECGNYDEFFSKETAASLRDGVFANLNNVPRTDKNAASAEDLSFLNLFSMTSDLVERNGVHFGNLFPNEAFIATWLRFIFEGQGQAGLLKNILGTPPEKDLSSKNWTYDFVGFGSAITSLQRLFLDQARSDFPDDLMLSSNAVVESGEPLFATPLGDEACRTLARLSKIATAKLKSKPSLSLITQKTNADLGLFQNYCSTCHTSGPKELPILDLDAMKNYRTHQGLSIIDRLKNQEMPPQGAPQPSSGERTTMINLLTR